MRFLSKFWNDDRGGTAVEYALIVGLIALAIVVSAGLLGDTLDTKFSEAALEVQNA